MKKNLFFGKFEFLIFLLVLMPSITACVVTDAMLGVEASEGHGYQITHLERSQGTFVRIEFRDRGFLEQELRAKTTNRMRGESEFTRESRFLPGGGKIFVFYQAPTIESANTRWLEYVILERGKEIYRRSGTDRIPNVPISSSTGLRFWRNSNVVLLDRPIEGEIEFVVINNLLVTRDVFVISAP